MSTIKENITCEHNVIESDGYHVCCRCGLIIDDLVTTSSTNDVYENNNPNENDKTFFKNFQEIDELESRNLITNNISQNAKEYVRTWYKKKIPLQKYHHAYAVYVSARKNNFPITLKEISFFLQIDVKNIGKVEKYFNFDFKDTPYDYISKYCNCLNLTFMDEKIVKSFLDKKYLCSEKSPSHIAAGAIFASFPKISLKELSSVTWVAPATIKKTAHDLQAGVFL